jgi:hypothetical protein
MDHAAPVAVWIGVAVFAGAWRRFAAGPREGKMRLLAIIAAAVLGASISSCTPPSGGGGAGPPLTFTSLETPNSAGGWGAVSARGGVFQVLPVQGRGVRINLTAPVGSVFGVTITSAGVPTPLTQNDGTPAPPDDGYFQVISTDPSTNPPSYTLYVRAPANLADPNSYSITIASLSGGASGAPIVVMLGPPTFIVNVTVQGGGHVTSNPSGINCGTSPLGNALANCTFDFGAATLVTLNPNSNNPGDFTGWTAGACSGRQVCTLAPTGLPYAATASFAGGGGTVAINACTQPPPLPGLTWIGQPQCSRESATSDIRGTLGCDAAGYFCCSTSVAGGAGDPRCANGGWQYPPDCRNQPNEGLNAVLRQPGGCYRVGG